jgi:hypothetical protein
VGIEFLRFGPRAHLAERFLLDLSNTLARDGNALSDFLQRQRVRLLDPEPQPEDVLLTRREGSEDPPQAILQAPFGDLSTGETVRASATKSPIFESPSAPAGASMLGGCLGARDMSWIFLDRQTGPLRNLLEGRLATVLLREFLCDSRHLVLRLEDVDRNTDGPRLVGESAVDGLADPPARVGAELDAACMVELVDSPHEADIAFLDEIVQRQSSVALLSRHPSLGGSGPTASSGPRGHIDESSTRFTLLAFSYCRPEGWCGHA